MYDSQMAYKAWAPETSIWSPWTKPVMFANPPGVSFATLEKPRISWVSYPDRRTALIVDLSGARGIEQGLVLANMGYRPVALYNGVNGPQTSKTVVDVDELSRALFQASTELAAISIRPDAAPAFLLDLNRMAGSGKQPGSYDNRWCIFPQDMPSAQFLKDNGINRIIIHTPVIQTDLIHILCRYQKEGINLFHTSDGELPRPITLMKPGLFTSVYYRFRTTMGLSRNAAGGFGAAVPDAQQSSGGRYYGVG